MNSTQVNCFLEAAKQKSFSKAAAKLFISQPTFSRNIAMIEEELGLTLFQRSSFHGIELTESGKIMMEAFALSKKEILAAHEKALCAEKEEQLNLTLGLLEGQLLDGQLEEVISGFRLSFPNISFSIRRDHYLGLMSALQADDVQIVYMPEWQFSKESSLTIQSVGVMETQLVIPKRLLPVIEDRSYSLVEFETFPFISVSEEESSYSRNMMLDLFHTMNMSPKIYEAGSIREQIGMVEMGEGIILINPNNSICYSPNVYCLKVKELEPQPFAICWKKKTADKGVEYFARYLQNFKNTFPE